MALVENVGAVDRILRVVLGALAVAGAVLLRAHLLGALVLAIAGLVIAVEGAIGH